MRFDTFIIWSTGIPHLNEIMVMLRAKFKILFIHRHRIQDIGRFVDDIYACDSYPLKHLKAKTQYLLATGMECYLILVENHHVDEQMVGEPPYRKPQCLYLQKVKNEIRAKFNPAPHNHVIHGTDYESQVDHIMKVFKVGNKESYQGDYPWHLPKPKRKVKVNVLVNQLKVNILGKGLVNIKESPHYKYVQGDKQEYINYHKRHVGVELVEDHFPEAFDDLINSWSYYEPIIIRDNIVLDGVHRLAIMADHLTITAYHVNI